MKTDLCSFAKVISIHLEETVINKFLTSASFFSDTTKIDLKISKFDLKWKVYDAQIDLTSKGSKFAAKIELITENKTRSGTVESEAKFKFDKKNQNLIIDVKDLKGRIIDFFNVIGFYKSKYELPI